MNTTKRIAALPAVFLGCCLALFGGCSPKKFSFEYQDKIYCYSLFDSNLEYAVIDEEAIKSFIDMLNACEKEKIDEKEAKELLDGSSIYVYYMKIGDTEFELGRSGCYSIYHISKEGISRKESYRLKGFDADVFNAFVEKRYEGGSPQS